MSGNLLSFWSNSFCKAAPLESRMENKELNMGIIWDHYVCILTQTPQISTCVTTDEVKKCKITLMHVYPHKLAQNTTII